MEAVGGSGQTERGVGTHPFTLTQKHLLRARPEGAGGKTELSPTTLQAISVQGLPKTHIL